MTERRPRRTRRRSRRARGLRSATTLFVAAVLVLVVGVVFGTARWFFAGHPRAVATTAGTVAPSAPASQVESLSPAPVTVEPTAPVEPAAIASSLPDISAERYLGTVLHRVPNEKHEIALTLDDGPSEDTEEVLEILAEHDVHVTFFIVGRRGNTHQQEIRDMAAQGHEVANHTWTHPEPGSISESDLMKQIDRNQKFITELTGRTPPFVRPRGGKFTDTTMENLKERGLILANWSIHSNDVEPSPSPEQIVKNATGGATAGSVILLHETNPNTVIALPKILEELKRKGLRPVTLSELVADDSSEDD